MAGTTPSGGPAPIIIKRKKGGGHGGHHGGAWKVAYADFVTAMMAFFLLLWLLNVTTEEQKNGIADYFTPATAALDTASGAGDILAGASVTVEGMSVSERSPVAVNDPRPQNITSEADTDEEEAGGLPMDEEELTPPKPSEPTQAELDKAIEEREKAQFEEVAEELRQAIQNVPELVNLQKSLIIDQTPEGLRIQIVDQEGYSMFPRGSASMDPRAGALLDLVAQAVAKLPNKLSISGHTDSTPFLNPQGYTNWELSSDRANAARRTIKNAGIPEDRVATVVGRADREPFVKENPEDPRNRRLSIILQRQSLNAPPPTAEEQAVGSTIAPPP